MNSLDKYLKKLSLNSEINDLGSFETINELFSTKGNSSSSKNKRAFYSDQNSGSEDLTNIEYYFDLIPTKNFPIFDLEKKDKYLNKILANLNDELEFDTNFIENELPIDTVDDSTENKLNTARSTNLDKKYTQGFINLLKEEDFEFGYSTRSEEIIKEQLKVNALATRNWLNEIFLKNFHDKSIILGILRIIGRFDPYQIFPQGQTIALAALSHSCDEIKELGIRAFEQWCSEESLSILKSINVESKWLKEYIEEVISDFEEQLCLY